MAIQKTPAPPSRSSLLRRIRALEAKLGDDAEGSVGTGRVAMRDDPAAEVHELIASGRPMTAVRRYRELTGASETEARQAIVDLGGFAAQDD